MANPSPASAAATLILRQSDFNALLPEHDVLDALRDAFKSLHAGTSVQPPQANGFIPDHVDMIWYPAIFGEQEIFGAKLSPWLPRRKDGPQVTAWTILCSLLTGEPVLLCDSKALTTERTAATTALAIEKLAPPSAKRLALIGAGPVGIAHLRYASAIHPWSEIRVYSRTLYADDSFIQRIPSHLREHVTVAASAEYAVKNSDVVMLCTSSLVPVIDSRWLRAGQLVTSVTTHATHAHEFPPAAVPDCDVYCDYRATSPSIAGEMVLAAAQHGWSPDAIRSDLPELISGEGLKPSANAPIFFRSMGLGIEDLAIANLVLRAHQGRANSQGGSSK
jgi:L-arginine dehydrogenase